MLWRIQVKKTGLRWSVFEWKKGEDEAEKERDCALEKCFF
jgi:hypothetical protein